MNYSKFYPRSGTHKITQSKYYDKERTYIFNTDGDPVHKRVIEIGGRRGIIPISVDLVDFVKNVRNQGITNAFFWYITVERIDPINKIATIGKIRISSGRIEIKTVKDIEREGVPSKLIKWLNKLLV